MRLSTEQDRDETSAIELLHTAFDGGVTFLDTADAYCLNDDDIGHNERLIARALASWSGDRSRIVVATKGGLTRPNGEWVPNGKARHLRAACEASLRSARCSAHSPLSASCARSTHAAVHEREGARRAQKRRARGSRRSLQCERGSDRGGQADHRYLSGADRAESLARHQPAQRSGPALHRARHSTDRPSAARRLTPFASSAFGSGAGRDRESSRRDAGRHRTCVAL